MLGFTNDQLLLPERSGEGREPGRGPLILTAIIADARCRWSDATGLLSQSLDRLLQEHLISSPDPSGTLLVGFAVLRSWDFETTLESTMEKNLFKHLMSSSRRKVRPLLMKHDVIHAFRLHTPLSLASDFDATGDALSLWKQAAHCPLTSRDMLARSSKRENGTDCLRHLISEYQVCPLLARIRRLGNACVM